MLRRSPGVHLHPVRRRFFKDAVVENTDSTARDHLANERTFLAWARTGLAYLGAGTGLFYSAYHIDHEHATRILPACGCFGLNGFGILAFAISRYFENAKNIDHGLFTVSKRSFIVVTAITTILTSTALAILYEEEVGLLTIPTKQKTDKKAASP